jgi:single-stranded DNA-binding protein
MMHFNSLACEGRIVKQIGVKNFAEDRSVCNFSIVNEGFKEKMYFNCSYFGPNKRADLLGGLKPGSPILLTGRLEPETYNNKQQFKYNVFDFQLMSFGGKPADTNNSKPVNSVSQSDEPEADAPNDDDDVPF